MWSATRSSAAAQRGFPGHGPPGEDPDVGPGHDVVGLAEPDLDDLGVLPGAGPDPGRPGSQRQQRGTGRGVLQTPLRGQAEVPGCGGQPFGEVHGPGPEPSHGPALDGQRGGVRLPPLPGRPGGPDRQGVLGEGGR